MFRKSILALSSSRSIRPRQITPPPRVPSLRKDLSTKPDQNLPPNPKSKSSLPGVILGSTTVAGAAVLVYQSGYLDQFIGEEQQVSHVEVKGTQIRKGVVPIVAEEPVESDDGVASSVARIEDGQKVESQMETETSGVEDDKEVESLSDLPRSESGREIETQTGIRHHEDLRSRVREMFSRAAEEAKPMGEGDAAIAHQEKHEPQFSAAMSPETDAGVNPEPTTSGERNQEDGVSVVPKEDHIKTVLPGHPAGTEKFEIDALCMGSFARTEEPRQIHSVYMLALVALALEDTLSQGFPIQKELVDLSTYLEGTDKDSLVQLVLSTLPEETRKSGTDTVLQLNQKCTISFHNVSRTVLLYVVSHQSDLHFILPFNALKATLRHHILVPPGRGGILAHAVAQIASWLRLKEADPSGDGIESVISRVQTLLSEGKLAEAADALQAGVRGSQAEQVASDWVKRAKNRAIMEQALTVLQSYTTCISLTQS